MTKQTIVHKGEAVTYRGQLVGFYDEIKDELELDERLAHIEVTLEDTYDHWEIVPSQDLDLAMSSKYVDLDSPRAAIDSKRTDERTAKLEAVAASVTNGLQFDELTERLARRQKLQEVMSRQHYIGESNDLVLAACAYAGGHDVV